MAMRWKLALILVLGVMMCLAASVAIMAEKGHKGQEVTIDQLPAAVRATLESQAQGGTIEEIEKKTKGGAEIYFAEVLKDNQKLEVKIAADGTLIKSEVESDKEEEANEEHEGDKEDQEVTLTFDHLPAPVQAALRNEAGAGTIQEIEQKNKDGAVVYCADVLKDGQKLEVKIAADGTLIKSEIEQKHEGSEKDEPGEQEEAGETD